MFQKIVFICFLASAVFYQDVSPSYFPHSAMGEAKGDARMSIGFADEASYGFNTRPSYGGKHFLGGLNAGQKAYSSMNFGGQVGVGGYMGGHGGYPGQSSYSSQPFSMHRPSQSTASSLLNYQQPGGYSSLGNYQQPGGYSSLGNYQQPGGYSSLGNYPQSGGYSPLGYQQSGSHSQLSMCITKCVGKHGDQNDDSMEVITEQCSD